MHLDEVLLRLAYLGNFTLLAELLATFDDDDIDLDYQKPDVNCVDRRGATPLIYCVQGAQHAGSTDQFCTCVELLVSNGAVVDQTDGDGQTALHWAVCCHLPALVRHLLLLDSGPTIEDAASHNAVFAAIKTGSLTCLDVLMKHCPQKVSHRIESNI